MDRGSMGRSGFDRWIGVRRFDRVSTDGSGFVGWIGFRRLIGFRWVDRGSTGRSDFDELIGFYPFDRGQKIFCHEVSFRGAGVSLC